MAEWTRDEVETIVADYFAMLQAELSGKLYSKADHNRRLQRRIARNKGSIEFKHQNISAVLLNFRQPFIPGYLPRQNYQRLLEQVVLEWLSTEPQFFQRLADGPVLTPRARPSIETGLRVTSLIEMPPQAMPDVEPVEAAERAPRFYRTDFVRRDAETVNWDDSARSGSLSSSGGGFTTKSVGPIWPSRWSGLPTRAERAQAMTSRRSIRTRPPG